jgi:CHAD domain-containing protein
MSGQTRGRRSTSAGTPEERLDAGLPAATAMRAYLGAQAELFLRHVPRLRAGLPEAAHQLRVASRRVRAVLRVCAPLLDPDWRAETRAELGATSDALAAERDLEVLRERLDAALDRIAADPAVPRARTLLHRTLDRERAVAHDTALAALAAPRFHALADRMTLLQQELPALDAANEPCGEVLPPLLDAAWRKLADRVALLRDEQLPTDDVDEAWHRVRITAKQVRYATELCVPVFGTPARALERGLAAVTDALGTQQDAVVALEMLDRCGRTARIAAPTGYALGLLAGVQRAEIDAARRAFPGTWQRLETVAWRDWLAATGGPRATSPGRRADAGTPNRTHA